MPVRLALLAALALAGTARAADPPLAVPLVVRETAGVPRRAFPARAGVPLPARRVRDPDALWVAAPDGRATLVQRRVLERWPDGSPRWLLVEFLADVPARGTATYTLRSGKPGAAAKISSVRLDTAGDVHLLDSGVLRVRVPSGDARVLAEMARADVPLPGPVLLPTLEVDGGPEGAPVPGPVSVETSGPVRTELLLVGRYPSQIAYEARVAVFAGQPFVRLQFTITNLGERHYAPLRALALSALGPFARGAIGVDGKVRSFLPLDRPHELLQLDTAPALLDGERAGRRADGWARAETRDGVLTLVVPEFWQQYPKAFRVAPDRLVADLVAAARDPVPFGTGAAKTLEAWLVVEAANTPPGDTARLATALAAPLQAAVPASWTVASKALPDAIAPETVGARDFLDRLSHAYDRYRAHTESERWDDGPPVPCAERKVEHPRTGLYGLLNWGDWQFPGYRDHNRGCDGWGNLEYDLPETLALGWLATGDRDYIDGLATTTLHFRDVDIAHHWPGHPERVGMNHPHKPLHFAMEAKETVDLGHVWTEGLVAHHRLTGEARSLAAARGIADAVAGHLAKARNPRQFGWPMLALASVFDATGEARYLQSARAYAVAGMTAFRPTPVAGDWKVGVLADGLVAVHERTDDPRILEWLVAYADALLADPGKYDDIRYSLPFGYLAARTGDARYRARALGAVRTLKVGEWGKPLAITGRAGFRLLGPLAILPAPGRQRERPTAAPRPAGLPGTPPPPLLPKPPTPGLGVPPRGLGPAPPRR